MTRTHPDPARRAPAEVDVERVAKTLTRHYLGYEIGFDLPLTRKAEIWRGMAEMALAALTAQGFSVVRREDLALAAGWYEVGDPDVMDEGDKAAYDRLRAIEDAALAAAQDEP